MSYLLKKGIWYNLLSGSNLPIAIRFVQGWDIVTSIQGSALGTLVTTAIYISYFYEIYSPYQSLLVFLLYLSRGIFAIVSNLDFLTASYHRMRLYSYIRGLSFLVIYSINIWQEVTLCARIENVQDLDRYSHMITKCEDKYGEISGVIVLSVFGVIDVHLTHIVYSVYRKIRNGEWVMISPSAYTLDEQLQTEITGTAVGRAVEEVKKEEEQEKEKYDKLKPIEVEILDYTQSQEESYQSPD